MIAGISKVHTVGTILSSPVVSGSVVYIGSADGNLYALY
jgi:outer membrane protein assembly factor BamB